MATLKSVIAKINSLKEPTTDEVVELATALEEARQVEDDKLNSQREALESSVGEARDKLFNLPTKEEGETVARGVDLAAQAVDVDTSGDAGKSNSGEGAVAKENS